MSKILSTSSLLAGLVLALGFAAGSVVRADTTPTTPTPAPAAPATPAPRLPHHSGSVSAVDSTAGSITIKDHKGNALTFTTTADTKIKVHGHKGATLADIQVGWDATIVGAEDKVATEIHARPHVDMPAPAPATPAPATPAPATPAPTH